MSDLRVKVGVRIRPMAEKEHQEGADSIVRNTKKEILIKVPGRKNSYEFDWAFGPLATQNEVYESVCKPLIEHIFTGYNATVFAYGQTGSGKSHSMGTGGQGSKEGIIPFCVRDIFQMKDSLEKEGASIDISFSYMEIYNDECYDLLATERTKLDIIENSRKETVASGLQQIPVSNIKAVEKLITMASSARSTASTAMNDYSSRSHAVSTFSLTVNKVSSKENYNHNATSTLPFHLSDESTGIELKSFTAKLHLVDLAGSERIKKTAATDEVLKQGIAINKGLLALGNVIKALSSQSKNPGKPCFIQYRDSKLTRLLKDSLGGNGMTVMLACVSPADTNAEETLSTLNFASRALSIINKVEVNHNHEFSNSEKDVLMKEMFSLKAQNDSLKREIRKLHQQQAAMLLRIKANQKPASESSEDIDCVTIDGSLVDEEGDVVPAEEYGGAYISSEEGSFRTSSASSGSRLRSASSEDDMEVALDADAGLELEVAVDATADEDDECDESINRLMQLEIRNFNELHALESDYEKRIEFLNHEIESLQKETKQLSQRMSTTTGKSLPSPQEQEKIRADLREKSKLLQDKCNELKQKESDYAKARAQKDEAQKEANRLKEQLEESRRRRAEAQRLLKEESQRHRAEKLNFQKSETQLLRTEQQNKLKIVELVRLLETKDRALKVHKSEKELASKKLKQLLEKQQQEKQVREKGRTKADDDQLKSKPGIATKFADDRSAVWVKEQIEIQIKRNRLNEEIKIETESRQRIQSKLHSLLQEHSAIISSSRSGVAAAKRSGKLALEINNLQEENKKIVYVIAQKKAELSNLGCLDEKRQFASIIDMCNMDVKSALNTMFRLLTEDGPKAARETEKKLSTSEKALAVLRKRLDAPEPRKESASEEGILDISQIADGDSVLEGSDQGEDDEAPVGYIMESDMESQNDADETFIPDDDEDEDEDYEDRPARRKRARSRRTAGARKVLPPSRRASLNPSLHLMSSASKKSQTDSASKVSKKRPFSDSILEMEDTMTSSSKSALLTPGKSPSSRTSGPREPLSNYTCPQLRAFLKARALSSQGNKPELVNRLRLSINEDAKKRRRIEGGNTTGFVGTAF